LTCPVCRRSRPLNPWVTGIWYSAKGEPVAVAYKCICGNNRNIPWAEATSEQRTRAYIAEASCQQTELAMPREG